MDNYRKKPTRGQTRQVIDGILNAPVNRINQAPQQTARHAQRTPIANSVQSSRRTKPLGDFTNLKEGYHSSDQTGDGRVTSQTKQQKHLTQSREIRKSLATPESTEKLSRKARRQQKKQRRRERRQKRATWKKWLIRISIALTVLIVAVVGFLVAQGYLTLSQIFRGGGSSVALGGEVDPTLLKGEGDGRVNVLLLGRGGEGHDGPDLTDTILIASLDPVNNKAALVSIPRDLWVQSDVGTSKVNAVFANAKNRSLNRGGNADAAHAAGVTAVKSVIGNILDINLHYYAMIDFEGFRKAVDTVGGVTIDVPEELRDYSMAWQNGGNPVLAPAGVQKMNGEKALQYVRSRMGSTRGDFDRAERQRLFIMALGKEITSASTYSNPLTLSRLMSDFGAHVRTDFSVTDLTRLYALTSKLGTMDSIGLVDEPHAFLTTGNVSGQSIVRPKDGLFDYAAIRLYIRSALPDGYITKENAPVVVLNGTTTGGVATTVAETLKSYAYNVTRADNAPSQTYATTLLIDLTGKNPYTKHYLEQRFGVRATAAIPSELAVADEDKRGFILIIGEDNN